MENKIIHSEQREKDLQKIANEILRVNTDSFIDNHGFQHSTCPFCKAYMMHYDSWFEMKELKHKSDCSYLVAKDLTTKLK